MSTIGLVILAAGASTRMGTPKQLLLYQGRSLLRHTVELALTSVCRPVVVVLGAYAEQMRSEVSRLPAQVVENHQWAEGMGASIRAGMQALSTAPDQIEAVILTLCDQPFVSAPIIDQLVEVYRTTSKPIVASAYAGTVGVPALFCQTLFPELITLRGSSGAKQVIQKYAREVYSVPFPEGAIDLDTPEDYEQFQTMASAGSNSPLQSLDL